ncbi:hypothetical protein RI129_003173 [Pyrocoelia pectoralis]|uniref:Uncharacterized protein n=1 Tax=Pyrocoelia pectoralis TaxID=417401 RepID=A0AAN7VNG0_9COLE
MDDPGNKCLICGEFGRNNEMWYRCTSCGLWAHSECTGLDSAEGYVKCADHHCHRMGTMGDKISFFKNNIITKLFNQSV